MTAKKLPLYSLNIKTVFTLLVTLFCCLNATLLSAQGTQYKAVSNNLITNSKFNTGITGWTVEEPGPANNEWVGWRWDNTFTYGSVLWIDNGHEPQPINATSNSMNLCVDYPKRVKFSFTSSNTGEYNMVVKLGGQVIGTFTNNEGWAQSIFTPSSEVEIDTIFHNHWPRHYVTDGEINNNIWHDFTITIPNYTGPASGELTFDYTLNGASRMVYLDNVEVYEIIPTPVPSTDNVNLPDCEPNTKYDLTGLEPADAKYTYTWFRSTDTSIFTNEVYDPTQVGVGTYYLFAKSKCGFVNNKYSYPSVAVTVNPGEGCCGNNVVMDGTFDQTQKVGSYDIPIGDTYIGGGTYWNRNFTNADNEFHITPTVTFPSTFYGGSWTLTKALKMAHETLAWNKLIFQKNSKISRWGKKIIEFDYVFTTNAYPSHFAIYLEPKDIQGKNYLGTTSYAPWLAHFYKAGFSATKKWEVSAIKNGITVKVNGEVAQQDVRKYNVDEVYRITIEVPANFDNSGVDFFGGIAFWGSNTVDKYIDNVSVRVLNPDAPILKTNSVAASCPDGLGNLNLLSDPSNRENNKNLTGLEYRWFYENSSTGAMVVDPTKVAPGTYYLFTFNPDTECYSDNGTAVTVIQDCPVIKGTVYDDWDGAANGGISNQSAVQNAQLYALLVNSANNVVKSMKLKADDGSFLFTGAKNTVYYVMISTYDVPVGTPAPAAPAYAPGNLPTGETLNGTVDGTADGKSVNFSTGGGASSISTVNFGINAVPMQDDFTFRGCVTSAKVTETIMLKSVDDAPANIWNEGMGQKVMIINPSITNGTLVYNSSTPVTITTDVTIDNYDPTKLVFTRTDATQNSKVEFKYAFVDAAGHSVLNLGTGVQVRPAVISYTFNAEPEIQSVTLPQIESGGSFTYKPENNDASGNKIPDGTIYEWTRPYQLGVSGLQSGTNTALEGISQTLINYTSIPKEVTYSVTATTPVGCESQFTITVSVNSVEYSCSNPWYSIGGTPTYQTRTIGTVTDPNPENDPPQAFTTTGVREINVNNMYGSSAIGVSTTAAGNVYFIPSQGNNYVPSIYLNVDGTSQQQIAELPTGAGNVKNMTFHKNGSMWIIGQNSHLYTLTNRQIQLAINNNTPILANDPNGWKDVGLIIGLPTGTDVEVADTEFNNGGSLYVLMSNGEMRIINPVQLNNVHSDTEVVVDDIEYLINVIHHNFTGEIIPDLSGFTFTGMATLSARGSFLVSAHKDGNSYLIELNMLATPGGDLNPRVTVVKKLDNVLIGDLASCACARNFWIGDISEEGKTPGNWMQNLVPRDGESIEFADGNNTLTPGLTAQRDLHVKLPYREAFNVVNRSDKALVIPAGSTLVIHGKVGQSTEVMVDGILQVTMISETNPDKVILEAAPDKPLGNLLLKNSAYKDGSETIAATVQFYNKGYDVCNCSDSRGWSWQYFGIPVTSASVFPASNLTPPGGALTVNRWDEPTTERNKWINMPENSTLTPFSGYEITSSGTTIPMDIYSFKGNLNVGNATVALTKTDGVNYSGFNLVGNSYTAAIPISELALQFQTELTEKTVYLYHTGSRDQWRKLNGTFTTNEAASGQYKAVPLYLADQGGLESQIPAMHAFMIKTDANNTLTIKYDQLEANKVVAPDVAWRSTSTNSKSGDKAIPNVIIDVLGTESADRVWLFQQPGTTQGFDNGWDGEKIIETGLAQIYVAGSDGNSYQVATVGDIEDTRFGFTAEMNGKYTLNLSVSPEIAARNLSLVDTQTGARVTLRNGAEYSFTAQEGDNGKRFKIVTAGTNIPSVFDKQPTENEHYIKIYSHRDEGVKVINQSGEDCMIEVYDVTGKQVLKTKIRYNSMETVLNSGSLHRGVYIVKVQGPTKRKVKRVLIH